MALLLQGFHQQSLGAFDCDPLDWTLSTQLLARSYCAMYVHSIAFNRRAVFTTLADVRMRGRHHGGQTSSTYP